MRRPLLPVTLAYLIGILLARTPMEIEWLFGLALGLFGLGITFARARRIVVFSLIALAGWINTAERSTPLSPNDLRFKFGESEELVTVRGTLAETPFHRLHFFAHEEVWSSRARVEITAVLRNGNWEPALGRVMTSTRERLPETFFAGQTVEVNGVLETPARPMASGLFDYAGWLGEQEIYYDLKVKRPTNWKIISSPARPPLADQFSRWAQRVIGRGFSEDDPAIRLEQALTFGNKDFLTEDILAPFQRAATYHLFAVDGLRVLIVSGIIIYLLRAARVPRLYAALISLPFIGFYTAMMGWPVSAIRALIMITVVFAGWALKRPSDLLNTLLASALIILVWQPQQLFQAGFQLSFFVVFCIIQIMPVLQSVEARMLQTDPLLPANLISWPRQKLNLILARASELFFVSLAAWLGSIPLVAYYFHIITPWSGLTNVIAVPIGGLILIANFAALLFAGWWPWLTICLNHAGWFFMHCLQNVSERAATLTGAFWYLPMPSWPTIGIYYLILIAIFRGWLFQNPGRKTKFFMFAMLASSWIVQQIHEHHSIVATILPLPGGHAVYRRQPWSFNDCLVDCGNAHAVDAVVKPYLQAQGVNRLGGFILTHGEAHYSGGAAEIYPLFSPESVFVSAIPFRSPEYRSFVASLQNSPALRPRVSAGMQTPNWNVIYPPASSSTLAKAADKTLVLSGDFLGVKLLLLSDLSQTGQAELLKNSGDLAANILVTAYANVDEFIMPELLDKIQPQVIVMADCNQPVSAVAAHTLKNRLGRAGIQVFFTSQTAAIDLIFRPDHFEVRSQDELLFSGKAGR